MSVTYQAFEDPAPDGRGAACCVGGPLLLLFPCDAEEPGCSELMVLLAARAARATMLGPPRMALMASATKMVLQFRMFVQEKRGCRQSGERTQMLTNKTYYSNFCDTVGI